MPFQITIIECVFGMNWVFQFISIFSLFLLLFMSSIVLFSLFFNLFFSIFSTKSFQFQLNKLFQKDTELKNILTNFSSMNAVLDGIWNG